MSSNAPSSRLPADVQVIVQMIDETLGPQLSLEALAQFTEAVRAKTLLFEHDGTMPLSIAGQCVAFRDSDVVYVRAGLDTVGCLITQLHEMAHLLLGHVPKHMVGADTPTYAEFKRRRNLPGTMSRSTAPTYAAPQEHAAELLATTLFTRMQHPPLQFAPDFY